MRKCFCREDKGTIGGIDWNKSPVAEFQTAHNPSPNVTIATPPPPEPNSTFSTSVMVIAVSVVCGVLLIGGLTLFLTVKFYSP